MTAELIASRHNATLVLTISNPAAKNSLHPEMYAAAVEALSTAEREHAIRAVVLTGADHFFCSGNNLSRQQENVPNDGSEQTDILSQLQGWIDALRGCPKPVIAAVDGMAAGTGFSLALACDLIVAGASAKFQMGYVRAGTPPDGAASWFLTNALPRQLASEILLEGKAVAAQRLFDVGLINKLVPDGDALTSALQWADELAELSSLAIEQTKSQIFDAQSNTLSR